MAHGGARQGSGRKPSGPETVDVNWRVSEAAKDWIKQKAHEDGVSIGSVIDKLIECYARVNPNIDFALVAKKIEGKITEEVFKRLRETSSDLYDVWMERMKLEICYKLGLPAKIDGKVVRVVHFSEWYDPYSRNELKISFNTVPMDTYNESEILEIDINKFK